jgi:hypothetical protein
MRTCARCLLGRFITSILASSFSDPLTVDAREQHPAAHETPIRRTKR